MLAVLLLSVILCAGRQTTAQTAAPQFDVVSIKPHPAGDTNENVSSSSGRYEATNVSVKEIVAGTYHVKAWLIFGLPPWAEAMKWDIVAKTSDADQKLLDSLTRQQRTDMVKALLADRFGLSLHEESRVQPVFEMTVLPDGPKFKPSPTLPLNDDGSKPKYPGSSTSSSASHLLAHRIRMEGLAENLSYRVERTIVDRTGLNAEYGYDVELTWTPDDHNNTSDNGTGTDAPPPIFAAVKEQLGLKLSPTKAEVPTLVIDHIQQPDAN